MGKIIRIGTRESQLALWQATQVKDLLAHHSFESELVLIKSEGDIDLVTPLYEIGVQGIFTRSLDAALLNDRIDVAVHSLKDVPTQLPNGIVQVAVLRRGPVNDLLVFKNKATQEKYVAGDPEFGVATSSIRRKAQWLNRFPDSTIYNLRGNVNTRLRKLQDENWDAAIFAQAGLERIGLRPAASIVLDWMLPAPAQGAIVVVCRKEDTLSRDASRRLNDADTELCTKIERDFLRRLLGGCSTPISALAERNNEKIFFRGNILSPDGSQKVEIERTITVQDGNDFGKFVAEELLNLGGEEIANIFAMPQNKITILSTRNIDQRLITEAAAKNIIVDTIPFIKTEPTSSIETQQEIEHLSTMTATVVFTSRSAVEAVVAELNGYQPDWQIFCIGHATRQAVEKFFLKNSIVGTAENAKDLAEDLVKKADVEEVIFFCGDQRRNELIDMVRAADIEVNEVIVYQTTPIPHLVEKKYDGILFFSPSAAKSFFQKNKIDDQTVLFAIGNTTANELKEYSKNKIVVSSRPDKALLLREMVAYFQTNPIHH